MNKQRQWKLIKITGMLIAIGVSVSLVLYALRQNISLYYTPSQLIQAKLSKHEMIRIGGRVDANSVHYFSHSTKVVFEVADSQHSLEVHYNGILPALFRVGQTVVVQGYLQSNGLFRADQVLAKHGANYHAP